jgi:prophage maintenance system killer protein
MLAFLAIHGHDVNADDDDVLTTVIDLAAGRLSEPDLAGWLRNRMVPNK